MKIADDLVAEMHHRSGGQVRNVIDAIAVAERVGRKTGGTVSLSDCVGMELMFDWQTRRGAVVKPLRKGV